MNFSFSKRLRSFVHAFNGVWLVLKTQHNSWIHLFATVGVVVFGSYFKVSKYEWIAIIISIVIVWVAEVLNSAIEFLADAVTLENNPKIKRAKDASAGAALIAAIGSVSIGTIVFYPYIIRLFS